MRMQRHVKIRKWLGAGVCLFAAMAMPPVAGKAEAEPFELSAEIMDGITAGANGVPLTMPREFSITPTILRTQQVTTRISMPVANAIALCLLCAPGASANATSIAVGDAQADSIASALGAARSDVVSTAVGLYRISPELLESLSALASAP